MLHGWGPGAGSGAVFGEVCAAEQEQERWDGHHGMMAEGAGWLQGLPVPQVVPPYL